MKVKYQQPKDKNLFNKDTPLYLTMIIVFISSIAVYSFFPHPSRERNEIVVAQNRDCVPELNVLRAKGFKFTHRILLSSSKNENPGLSGIKQRINQFITEEKSTNVVSNVSVYYRSLKNGEWFAINGDSAFIPASLIKVATLITILKQAEKDPGLLNTKLYFDRHLDVGYEQNIKNFKLEEKKYYTVKELLSYMITYSDNDATALIHTKLNKDVYYNLYKDLEITPPVANRPAGTEYAMSVLDYCKFFRVLYNSSYLKDEYSEFALQLLTQSNYKDGFLKNMKADFPVAHKFGERVLGNVRELHEVAIFYIDRKPYILGVMSTGSDLKQLSTVLSQISNIAYEESAKLN